MQVAKKIMWVLLISFVLFALTGSVFGDEVVKKPAKASVQSIMTSSVHHETDTYSHFNINGTIKFEETFADTIPPAGWVTVNADGSPPPNEGWEFVTGLDYGGGDTVIAQTGQGFWFSNFENANGFLIDEWLMSPELPAVQLNDTIYFYGGAIGGSFDDSIQVRLAVTDPMGDPLSFDIIIDRYKMDGPIGNWTLYKAPVPDSLDGLPIWVAFRYWHTNGGPSGANSDNVWLDHIIYANGGLTAIDDKNDVHQDRFTLYQNYPNPFNPTTTIAYDLNKSADVTIKIYNLAGQEVNTLVNNENQSPGSKQVVWDGRDSNGHQVASGIYLYKLQAGSTIQTRKMILLK
jgi:hypothetical protein